MKIAALPDDGIGTEIVAEAVKVLNAGPKVGDGNHSGRRHRLTICLVFALLGFRVDALT